MSENLRARRRDVSAGWFLVRLGAVVVTGIAVLTIALWLRGPGYDKGARVAVLARDPAAMLSIVGAGPPKLRSTADQPSSPRAAVTLEYTMDGTSSPAAAKVEVRSQLIGLGWVPVVLPVAPDTDVFNKSVAGHTARCFVRHEGDEGSLTIELLDL